MTHIRRLAESLTRHFESEKRRNARRFATSVARYRNLLSLQVSSGG
jgi:hypothetical protein